MKIKPNLDLNNMDFDILSPVILPIIVIILLFIIFALVDLYRNKSRRKNVLVWTIVIILVIPLGPILYFIIGRKDSDKR
ncbi:PLD nuclease N-terminal domain-containing protein [Caldifermentibacillus hisashii]|uniref:PLD nuclease N-terminal domain-containing protein n=2 Tax=Bacillales TaxID=1385 RepID=A0ABU9JX44_9BACI|nr:MULTISPECIES: PLD nuclease N-terminal domain-containing protein [Bacillaceae]MCM3055907.1 PLD nuclease N-terminal domain-containing protein [Caldibacillus thermoamylovorans]MEC5271600.1 PLD nuclease N-terminal domain-containing protein [Caldifermentibacillus hisashii]